jgi:hypothetical protein
MSLCNFFSMSMPAATTGTAAVISVLGAIGTAVLAYMGNSALEKRKSELTTQLEAIKAGLADDLAARNARRDYEYDARKRLYVQVEPLLFQLFEAAETAFNAVASLARTQRQGNLPQWLSPGGGDYYIRSIIHRLFLPLANYRLIQRSMTLIDLNLDPSIRLRYALLKESYLTWTDHFGLAELAPSLPYEANVDDWEQARARDPAKFWRQGLVIGNLDRLLDAMIVDDGPARRPMNFGEWEVALNNDTAVRQIYKIVEDIFLCFDFGNRPVLSRLLMSYACTMHTLMMVYNLPPTDDKNPNLEKILSDFVADAARSDTLRWWGAAGPDVFEIVRPYVLRRFKQALHGSYATF